MREFNVNAGKNWTKEDIKFLRRLAREETPTVVMSYLLGRSEESIRSRASQEGIALLRANKMEIRSPSRKAS